MRQRSRWGLRLVGAGLLVGSFGCSLDDSDGKKSDEEGPETGADLNTSATGLLRAEDCTDLLTKIQDDAIAKLDLTVALYKNRPEDFLGGPGRGEVPVDDVAGDGASDPAPGAPPPVEEGSSGDGDSDGNAGGDTGGEAEGPTGSSDTNTQVQGVDEADFVKVANGGENMYLLHGNRLHKLKSWPAADTALLGDGLEIEGAPSEMFVNDAGKAVVFSSVFGYGGAGGGKYDGDYACGPGYCGGTNFTKVTIADVSGETPKTERELYYEGYYVSSRRYEGESSDVVRVVMQASPQYYDLFTPSVDYTDPFGRPYSDEEIATQLTAWRNLTAEAIRTTKLDDWLPLVQEAKGGTLSNVDPTCDSYFMPQPGLSDYGLTHVLSVDVAKADGAVGGVTIMGATSTVYSNSAKLVLAQPDYRAMETDFGFVDGQQTILHQFSIAGADTKYDASGAVPGMLAGSILQFALDEHDGVIRAVTSGWKRTNPDAPENSEQFWQTETVNRLVTAKLDGGELKVVGELSPLGKTNESVYSSRFMGDRGYIVTALRTDPLIVVDLTDETKPTVLGELEIPGFSNYLHPLDETHLLALGANASLGGTQLQIFDVSDASAPKQTFVHDFGDGTSSEASYQHKALTFFAEQKLLAMPLYGYDNIGNWTSRLAVLRVDAAKGFTDLGFIDHTSLIQNQTWDMCDAYGNCWAESCMSWTPEVRRGHFVSSDSDVFAYSFSYGGVMVHDVSNLETALTEVSLPAPAFAQDSWYGLEGDNSGNGGGSVRPDEGDGDVAPSEPDLPPPDGDMPPVGEPEPDPGEQDAGAAEGG